MRIQYVGGFIKGIQRFLAMGQVYNLSPEAEYRLNVIAAYKTKFKNNASQTARYFGIHRNSVHKYLRLYNPHNLYALEPNKPLPLHRVRKQLPKSIESMIVQLKKAYPYYGKEKLKVLLARKDIIVSSSSIGRICKKHKLTYLWRTRDSACKFKKYVRQKRKKKRPPKAYRARRPGQWVQIDTIVIYHQGVRQYVMNAVDLCTRFAFSRAYSRPSSASAKDFFLRLQQFFPEPFPIQNVHTDNGSEFMKHFHAELEQQSITHTFSYPKTPKMNAFVESFNKTIQVECLKKNDAMASISQLNQKITKYIIHYNTQRPHQSIDYKVPLQLYLQHSQKLHTNIWTSSVAKYLLAHTSR